jgi:hypothetical protein
MTDDVHPIIKRVHEGDGNDPTHIDPEQFRTHQSAKFLVHGPRERVQYLEQLADAIGRDDSSLNGIKSMLPTAPADVTAAAARRGCIRELVRGAESESPTGKTLLGRSLCAMARRPGCTEGEDKRDVIRHRSNAFCGVDGKSDSHATCQNHHGGIDHRRTALVDPR